MYVMKRGQILCEINPFHTVDFFTYTRVGNSGINDNFVFPRICSFLHYLYFTMLGNVKLDVSS